MVGVAVSMDADQLGQGAWKSHRSRDGWMMGLRRLGLGVGSPWGWALGDGAVIQSAVTFHK